MTGVSGGLTWKVRETRSPSGGLGPRKLLEEHPSSLPALTGLLHEHGWVRAGSASATRVLQHVRASHVRRKAPADGFDDGRPSPRKLVPW